MIKEQNKIYQTFHAFDKQKMKKKMNNQKISLRTLHNRKKKIITIAHLIVDKEGTFQKISDIIKNNQQLDTGQDEHNLNGVLTEATKMEKMHFVPPKHELPTWKNLPFQF